MLLLASLRGSIVERPVSAGRVSYLLAALCNGIIGKSLGTVESASATALQRNISVQTLALINRIHKHILTTLRHNDNQVTYIAILIVLISRRAGHDDLVAFVSCGIVSSVSRAVRKNQITQLRTLIVLISSWAGHDDLVALFCHFVVLCIRRTSDNWRWDELT